jgi:hypothetical protein
MKTERPPRRGVALAMTALAALSFAACGSDDGGTQPTEPAATTATTNPPIDTSTSTSAPATTGTEAPRTTPPPPTAAPSTTSAASTAITAAATTIAPATTVFTEYQRVKGPDVPAVTAPITEASSLADGVYYGIIVDGGDPPPAEGSSVFQLLQLFTGRACAEHFGPDDTESCLNDYGVEPDPVQFVEVPLVGSDIEITVADAESKRSYRISSSELYALLHGDEPAIGAPKGYAYAGFGYIVTVQGGDVVKAEQWWTP